MGVEAYDELQGIVDILDLAFVVVLFVHLHLFYLCEVITFNVKLFYVVILKVNVQCPGLLV